MNNKSIQKKTKQKKKSEGSLFGAELSAGGEQLLAKKGLKNCGLWAAQQAPLANPICRNEIQRKDDVWWCGGVRSFFSWFRNIFNILNNKELKDRKKSAFNWLWGIYVGVFSAYKDTHMMGDDMGKT